MQIVQGFAAWHYSPKTPPTVVAIGMFDGVHLGHQALIQQAVTLAQNNAATAVIYTFNPHPARVLRPQAAPALIEPLSSRLNHFKALGIEAVVVEPFCQTFAEHSAEFFAEHILGQVLQAGHVVVGEGFVFGHRQQGHVELLQHIGQQCGFVVHAILKVQQAAQTISSTQIRKLIATGHMPQAAALLGRPYSITGRVVLGAQRGRRLGFPTANVALDLELLPALGVYAGFAEGSMGRHPMIANVGLAPTFGELKVPRCEIHLLNYQGADFYDADMVAELHHMLRPEKRFASVDDLKNQIKQDLQQARSLLA